MKKILIFCFLLFSLILKTQVPCPNDNSFWLNLTPTGPGNTQSSSCTYAGEYDTFNASVGVTYSFSICGGSYDAAITMYSNSGTLLYSQNATSGNGCETFTWTSSVTGTVRLLIDVQNCSSNSICTSVSITQVSGGGSSGNQNCGTPTSICNDASFVGNSSGLGTQDLNATNQGCLSVEHQSSWYIFQAVTSGTISLTITTSVDYDFAIWGPNLSCATLGTPIRCSFAAGGANTGLGNGATDNSESASGDKWVAPLPVTAGQTFIMLIDNFTANSTSFTLDWTMAGGASLNCGTLPIELLYFNAEQNNCNQNLLTWSTATESNNNYFQLERSNDGINFITLEKIMGSANSTSIKTYNYKDNQPESTINYYRLKQVDFDGSYTYSNITYVDNSCSKSIRIVKVTNLLGQEVGAEFNGPRFIFYSDGSVVKRYQ